MNDSTERFLQVLDELVYSNAVPSIAAFVKVCPNLYAQKVNNMKTKKNKVTVDMLEEIMKVFPNINANWILTGNGNMFTDNSAPSHPIVQQTSSKTDELLSLVIEERERNAKKDEQMMHLINFVTSKLSGDAAKQDDKGEVL